MLNVRTIYPDISGITTLMASLRKTLLRVIIWRDCVLYDFLHINHFMPTANTF